MVMLNVIMLSVVTLSVFMPSVVILNFIMLNVVASVIQGMVGSEFTHKYFTCVKKLARVKHDILNDEEKHSITLTFGVFCYITFFPRYLPFTSISLFRLV
jgi:hypothetical protein